MLQVRITIEYENPKWKTWYLQTCKDLVKSVELLAISFTSEAVMGSARGPGDGVWKRTLIIHSSVALHLCKTFLDWQSLTTQSFVFKRV